MFPNHSPSHRHTTPSSHKSTLETQEHFSHIMLQLCMTGSQVAHSTPHIPFSIGIRTCVSVWLGHLLFQGSRKEPFQHRTYKLSIPYIWSVWDQKCFGYQFFPYILEYVLAYMQYELLGMGPSLNIEFTYVLYILYTPEGNFIQYFF